MPRNSPLNQRSIGVVGAGILGRLLAHRCAELGAQVSLFDRGLPSGVGASSYVAAGMLAPFCELESAERLIFDLGRASLKLWPAILAQLPSVYFQFNGSLVVAHPNDHGEIDRFQRRTGGVTPFFELAHSARLRELEPALDGRFQRGLYCAGEGQVDARALLLALHTRLLRLGVKYHGECEVLSLARGEVRTRHGNCAFDWVIDCRGFGAREDLTDLRAVRGELIWLEASEIELQRPIRLLHPKYPLYLVPRPKGRILVGATLVESDDLRPISLRSTLELLSAAFSVSPALAEARVVESCVGLRPAFADNLPRVEVASGRIRINGLFRHGFLISPQLVELVCAVLRDEVPAPQYQSLFAKGA